MAWGFSVSFKHDLLPGMYSPPVYVEPKPELTWLVFIWMESTHSLHLFKNEDKHMLLVLFKSDVSVTYCQLPMHLLYQIPQVVPVEGQQYVDRNNNFGVWASQIIWQSFISLVIWILVFKCGLCELKCYIDDAFAFAPENQVSWYTPYW